MPDWREPNAYRFTAALSAGQWAWEFLRRNPRYRTEWSEFIATWQALEAAYGKPAERDINAWQQDQRAWLPAAVCQESDCRVSGDRVLIECAMGARWGFYKFPPDPRDDDPVGQGRLVWRECKAEIRLLEEELVGVEATDGMALVCFDLELPLQDQLTAAKQRLQMEQRRRIRSGQVLAPHIVAHREHLCRKLRLLDALQAGAQESEISQRLSEGLRASVEQDLAEAIALRDRDYRRLLLLE